MAIMTHRRKKKLRDWSTVNGTSVRLTVDILMSDFEDSHALSSRHALGSV